MIYSINEYLRGSFYSFKFKKKVIVKKFSGSFSTIEYLFRNKLSNKNKIIKDFKKVLETSTDTRLISLSYLKGISAYDYESFISRIGQEIEDQVICYKSFKYSFISYNNCVFIYENGKYVFLGVFVKELVVNTSILRVFHKLKFVPSLEFNNKKQYNFSRFKKFINIDKDNLVSIEKLPNKLDNIKTISELNKELDSMLDIPESLYNHIVNNKPSKLVLC